MSIGKDRNARTGAVRFSKSHGGTIDNAATCWSSRGARKSLGCAPNSGNPIHETVGGLGCGLQKTARLLSKSHPRAVGGGSFRCGLQKTARLLSKSHPRQWVDRSGAAY